MPPFGGLVLTDSTDGFALYGVGLGIIAPNGVWVEGSIDAFFPFVDRSVIGGYAFGYHVATGTWDFSVPVFAGYRYAVAFKFPGEIGYPGNQYLKMVTAGGRVVWSYDTVSRHLAVEIGLGLDGSWVVERETEPYANAPIHGWIEPKFILGVAFE